MAASGLDEDFLSSRHKLMFAGPDKSVTLLTSLYYVPLTDERAEEVGSIRIAEHTDYGTLTLILQDDMGGLQVGRETFNLFNFHVSTNCFINRSGWMGNG